MSYISTISQQDISLQASPSQWLEHLGRPTWIAIEGHDSSRTRILTTLLHGNEPSGLRALHRFLQEEHKPATNMGVFIGSVEAALTPPEYSHRFLPQNEDLNRAFKPPFDSPTGKVAKQLMSLIEAAKPEAVIDLHNTSGSSMGFAICVKDCLENEALASLFIPKLIVADIKLGSLMEYANRLGPCVTIECGGIQDKTSDILAYEGIKNFWKNADILTPLVGQHIQKIYNPMRLELNQTSTIGFSSSINPEWDVTLYPDIEQYNYKILQANQPFGWVKDGGLDTLNVMDSNGQDRIHDFFEVEGNSILAKEALRLFMVTTNPNIAKADCLFYLVMHHEEQLVSK